MCICLTFLKDFDHTSQTLQHFCYTVTSTNLINYVEGPNSLMSWGVCPNRTCSANAVSIQKRHFRLTMYYLYKILCF
jgi:hypothetical protein